MGELGLPELLIIAVVILLLFGPSRLPQAGAGLGKAIRSFKDALAGKDEPKPAAPPRQDPPRDPR
jgi:sec-independent protein translocase protein TatA